MFAHTNIYKYFDKRIYKYWKTFKAKSDEGQTLGSWIKKNIYKNAPTPIQWYQHYIDGILYIITIANVVTLKGMLHATGLNTSNFNR